MSVATAARREGPQKSLVSGSRTVIMRGYFFTT